MIRLVSVHKMQSIGERKTIGRIATASFLVRKRMIAMNLRGVRAPKGSESPIVELEGLV